MSQAHFFTKPCLDIPKLAPDYQFCLEEANRSLHELFRFSLQWSCTLISRYLRILFFAVGGVGPRSSQILVNWKRLLPSWAPVFWTRSPLKHSFLPLVACRIGWYYRRTEKIGQQNILHFSFPLLLPSIIYRYSENHILCPQLDEELCDWRLPQNPN